MDAYLLPEQWFPVECIDSVLCFVSLYKFHQSVSFGHATFAVGIQNDGLDAPVIRKGFTNIILLGFLVYPCYKRNPAFDTPKRP